MERNGIARRDEKEREIERKVWSECFLCEEEYSKDIRINKECLHSYCKECIEQTATTSQICPICHVPLPSPLSSLPINHTLLHWQTLSPKQIINLSLEINDKESSEAKWKSFETKYCQQCEKSEVEISCDECNFQYCSSCSQQIHSLKALVNHKLTNIVNKDSQNVNNLSQKTPLNNFVNNFTEFYKCSLHSIEEMKLYCKDCHQFVCVYCIDQFHSDHKLITVMRFVDEMKENWKNNIVSSKSSNQSLKTFLSQLSSNEKKLDEEIKKLDDEIEEIEDKLKTLKVKREGLHQELDLLIESKEKIDLSTRFLNNFIDKLPPLPLSSFLPSSFPIQTTIIIDNDKKVIKEVNHERIKDFFEENILSNFFLGLVFPVKEHYMYQFPFNKYSIDHINEIKELIFNNQLTSSNLVHSFTLKYNIYQSKTPFYLSVCSKLNLIVLKYYSGKVKILDLRGNKKRSLKIDCDGIAIIPSLSLIAISHSSKNNIRFYDMTNLNKKYDIGDGLNKPMGICFCPQNGLLVVCNRGSKEIHFFRFDDKNSSWKFHSKLPFSFPKLREVCISPNHLIVGDENALHFFSIKSEKGEEFTFQRTLSAKRKWKNVTIHPTGNYWIACTSESLYFITFTGKIICQFTPKRNFYANIFSNIEVIEVNEDDDLIYICDSRQFFIIKSLLINGNSYNSKCDIDIININNDGVDKFLPIKDSDDDDDDDE